MIWGQIGQPEEESVAAEDVERAAGSAKVALGCGTIPEKRGGVIRPKAEKLREESEESKFRRVRMRKAWSPCCR